MAESVSAKTDRIEEIWNLLEPVVGAEGMEILEIEYRRESIGWVLRIFIDSERGVAVEDCAAISRVAGDVLDVADLIPTSYHLEVSSPGLNRPLRKWEQFKKQIGDIVEIRTISPVGQSRRNFKGTLKEASPESVTIECDGQDHTIPLPLVERARLLYFETMKRKER
ncbi:MAG: ribosome maturation factor RimP [Syntrophobacteraceae bacterium]